jgi:pimeloyl-ACP methyl ester carboxylesterase
VVLVPGWPKTAEAYSEVFRLLAKNHSVIAVDPPRPGDSTPSEAGYNTGAISRTLDTSLRSRTQKGFHLAQGNKLVVRVQWIPDRHPGIGGAD